MEEVKKFEVYCDGSGFNNVNSSYCVIIKNWKRKTYKGKIKYQNKREVKVLYKNKNVYEIEYLAIVGALKLCDELIKENYVFKIYSDNQGIVEELNLLKKTKDKKMFDEAKELMEKNNITISWIPREKNLAGIYLERRLEKLREYGKNGWRKK